MKGIDMWKRSILLIALAVGLLTMAGVAVAAIGSNTDSTATNDEPVTTAASATDYSAVGTSTTTSITVPDEDSNDDSMSDGSMANPVPADDDGDDDES